MPPYFILLLTLGTASIAGCSRSVPTTFPESSAASLQAADGRAAPVGRAIREEPPLPGESREGWEALERDAGAPAHGGHHGHHGGHGHAH